MNRFNIFAFSILSFIIFVGVVFFNMLTHSSMSFAATDAQGKTPNTAVKDIDQVGQLTGQLLQFNKSLNSSAKSLSAKDQTVTNQTTRLTEIAKKRKALLLNVIEKDPIIFLTIAMKKTMQLSMPAVTQDYLEKEVTVEGKTEVLHVDDFKNPENSKFSYFVKTDNQKLSLYPTQELSIVSGAKIRVKGIQLENKIAVNTNKASLQILEEAPKPESVGGQKTLVLLMRFQDSGPEPFTKEKAYDLIFNGQFQKFYKEQSYNQVSFSGDVFGWFTLPSTCLCNYLEDPEIQRIILENNINLDNYDRSVILLDRFGTGGAATVGKTDVVVNNKTYHISDAFVGVDFNQPWGDHPFEWTFSDFALSHEMGHSLGTLHANGWDCKDQVLYGECMHIEYGNFFDTMGYGLDSLHFNAFYKELLGWMDLSSSLLISTSGAYTINPLELDSGTKFAKIQLKDSTLIPFYLEYRKGIGFDANLDSSELSSNQSGLFINLVGQDPDRSRFSSSHLLDMSSTSSDWFDDIKSATLNGENIFTDPGRGIKVGPILKVDESSITFDVKITDLVCVSQEPLVNTIYHSESVASGGIGYVAIGFTNTDNFGCGMSEFNLAPTFPLGWEYAIYPPENITLASEQRSSKTIDFRVPEDAPDGNYLINYDILNVKSGLKTHKEFTVIVKPDPKISRIDPETGSIGTNVTIFGSGFDETASNYIFFSNIEGYATTTSELFQIGDEQVLKFMIPNTICAGGVGAPQVKGGGDCARKIKTPLGNYSIFTSNSLGAYSNIVNFEVLLIAPCGQYGDVDLDGKITKNDADLIAQYVVGAVTLTDQQKQNADVNGNGSITIVDAQLIGQYVNGAKTTFPVCSMCTACNADVNKDGIVTKADSYATTACFGKKATASCVSSDVNHSGTVNVSDIGCINSKIGQMCSR